MAEIGAIAEKVSTQNALARARQRAALVPDLLVEARQIVATVISGWHGRRKRGIGENFWQYRPYVDGESRSRIDWRRSARDEHIYVRDNEWEAAHTVWIWADSSPSMLYRSQMAQVSKQSRGLVLALALAELLARSGERIAWPQLTDPIAARNAAERLAEHLIHASDIESEPDLTVIRRFSDLVVISDFLDPVEEIKSRFEALAERSVRVHFIEVSDPAEEDFPYSGHTEFRDPETGLRLRAGRAEIFRDDYRTLFQGRREELAQWARRLGWSYTVNHTDKQVSTALVSVHMAMSEPAEFAGASR